MELRKNLFLAGEHLKIRKEKLWLVAADAVDGARFHIIHPKKQREIWRLSPGEYGIVALALLKLEAIHGSVKYTELDFSSLCKLLAFVDAARQHNIVTARIRNWVYHTLSSEEIRHYDAEKVDVLFLNYFLENQDKNNDIVSFFRSSENYWLIRFLLEESKNNILLKDISIKYGLSPSHFRRLTRQALGKNTKCELKNWRVIRALLASIGTEKKPRLTDIAIEHGYASLSHFSGEVKSLFGVSPKDLKNSIINDAKK